MVKLTRTGASHLDGLKECAVPVGLLMSQIELEVSMSSTSKQHRTVVRRECVA
jgi:hypothetical protein